MAEIFGNVFEWMEGLSPFWAYGALLAVAYGENVVPPIPGDMVVVFGGYLAGTGHLDLLPVIGIATVGGALGFMTMYWIGYRLGDALITRRRLKWLSPDHLYRAQRLLRRWGYGIVAANRFLSGLRSVISLAVGMAQMEPWKTAAYATLSSAVWTALIAYGGYAVGENWEIIGEYLRAYGRVVITLLVLVALGIGGWMLWRRRTQKAD
jgi:membrane protein DedA with SNARE-associated domain